MEGHQQIINNRKVKFQSIEFNIGRRTQQSLLSNEDEDDEFDNIDHQIFKDTNNQILRDINSQILRNSNN